MEKRVKTAWFSAAYSVPLFRRDLAAGLTVAAVAIPQGMAYALIAGVPPQYGLYTAIVLTALASLFGSSSYLINGPTNAISLVVFSAVAVFSAGPDDPEHMQRVALLAILVGLIQVVIALLKLGDLTRYISESVVLGFMAGAGILIALGQVPNLLGLERSGTAGEHFLYRLWLTLRDGGSVHYPALGVGLATLVLIVGLRQLSARLRVKLPELLLSLVVVSVATWTFDWRLSPGEIARVDIVRQLPSPHLPTWRVQWIQEEWGGALAIALLGLVESLAIAKAIAARTREPLDFNRQCLAEGLANLGGGLFRCMPGSGSLTRSRINYESGAATRVSGVVAAGAVAGTLMLFAPLASHVPKPALAGVLLWTAWRIVDRGRFRQCLRATRFDATIALATAAAAIFISIEFSILIGTFLSFLFFVPRAARLQAHELVVSRERVLRERQPDDPQCSKMALFSLEGELFFGAAPELDDHLAELQRRVETGVRIVVLRLKRARHPDMVCLERLQRFLEDMQAREVVVLLCGVRADFAAALHNLRFDRLLPADRLFLEDATTGSSTLRAVRRAYELLGQDRCSTCPRAHELEESKGDWYYVI
ncbi:MAG TPA: SulP family inorganic anion transporter, partial [Gemmataceae bacterium]|nr:SulP family inorganic anion transporter [Gemmataceae bacterium]